MRRPSTVGLSSSRTTRVQHRDVDREHAGATDQADGALVDARGATEEHLQVAEREESTRVKRSVMGVLHYRP